MKKPNIEMAPRPIHSAVIKRAVNGRLSGLKMSAALQQRILDEIKRIDQVDMAPQPAPPQIPVVKSVPAPQKSKERYDASQIAADIRRIKAAAPPAVPPTVSKAPVAHDSQDASRLQTKPVPIEVPVPEGPADGHRFRAGRLLAVLAAAVLIFCLSFSVLGATVPEVNDLINSVSPEFAEFLGRENLISGRLEENLPEPPDDAVCVADGIELRITGLQTDGGNLFVFYTLRDATDQNRLNQYSDFQLFGINGISVEGGRYWNRYDEETGALSVAAVFTGCLGQDERMGLLLKGTNEDGEETFIALGGEKWNLDFRQVTTLTEYKAIPIEIDFSGIPASKTMQLGSPENGYRPAGTIDGPGAELAQAALDADDLTVLVPGGMALLIDGLDFAEISNIGFVDHQLHIQVHFFDYDTSLACGWESLLAGHIPEDGDFDLADLNQYLRYCVTFPEDPERGEGNYFEYVYRLSEHDAGDQELFAVGFWEAKIVSEEAWAVKAPAVRLGSVYFEGDFDCDGFTIRKITVTPYVIQFETADRALADVVNSVTIILNDGTEISFSGDEDPVLISWRAALPDGGYLVTCLIYDWSDEPPLNARRVIAIRINDILIDPYAPTAEPVDPVDPILPTEPEESDEGP